MFRADSFSLHFCREKMILVFCGFFMIPFSLECYQATNVHFVYHSHSVNTRLNSERLVS